MNRLHVVVEGATEETFVEELIYPHLLERGIVSRAHPLGGNIRYPRVKTDVLLLLKSDPSAFVTTFFDFYGIGKGFPDMDTIGKLDSALVKKLKLEGAVFEDIRTALGKRYDLRRFIPYVQMHEFEGLLFSAPERAAAGMYRPDIAPALRAIRESFATPEDINDSRKTAPSKRIEAIIPGYNKPTLGNLAAIAVGLDAIRMACPLFDDWLTKLEQIGQPPASAVEPTDALTVEIGTE